jgi:hypothetical protein
MMRSALHIQLKLQEATSLNEKGVTSLASFAPSEALKSFQGALRALHELDLTTHTCSDCGSSAGDTIASSIIWPGTTRCRISDLHHDTFFVYDKALLVKPDFAAVVAATNAGRAHIRFYCAAICFNMGLAFHLKGKLTRRSAKRSQRRAALCYAQSLQYIDSMSPTTCTSADTTMMTLLALNNSCQIHYQLCQRTELQCGLERIRKLSLAMLQLPGVVAHCPSLSMKVLGGLFMNMLVSDLSGMQAASAA